MKKRLLVVDDDPSVREGLRASGYEVIGAGDGDAAQIAFRSHRPDAAVVGLHAIDLMERFRAVDPHCPVIVLGSASVPAPALARVVERCLPAERPRVAKAAAPSPFVGESAAIRLLEERVRRVLDSAGPLLLTGETGTGKGVLARWIHEHGPRAGAPFVDLNCAGLSAELLDTELFGHERGAFTGAVQRKAGLFEVANGGTMLLDEIGDVDAQIQPKLLKVVEEKRFRRLGEVGSRTVDVFLIGATHRDLTASVASGAFRADLFFRINTFPIHVPSLRERAEDVPLLARQLLETIGGGRHLTRAAQRALQRHPWPGNVRELRNVLERAALAAERETIDVDELNLAAPAAASRPDDLGLSLDDVERRHIELILNDERGHIERAAARLRISRSSLYNKVRAYGLRLR